MTNTKPLVITRRQMTAACAALGLDADTVSDLRLEHSAGSAVTIHGRRRLHVAGEGQRWTFNRRLTMNGEDYYIWHRHNADGGLADAWATPVAALVGAAA